MDKNTFATTPPMGWNSYDYYDTTVTEKDIKANADYMAKHLKQYGWEYIVVDIEWYAHGAGSQRDLYQYIPFASHEMDEYSRLLPDPARFPSAKDGAGFAPLADYIHSLGLKFGIHIMRGIPRNAAHNHGSIKGTQATANMIANPSSISRWNPDMYGVRNNADGQAYYNSILELYASWGVDYIKCDDICNTNMYPHAPYSARHEVEMLAHAIQNCGRPIVFSLSPGPALIDQAWHYEKYANMWRITDDLWDQWNLLKDMFHRCELWQNHVSQGCFPDCDMLPLGRLGKGFGHEWTCRLTKDEQRTMLTLWCIFGSPLMLGAEMTLLDDWTLSLLTNENILAMLTPDCRPQQVCRDDNQAIWTAHNANTGDTYIALFNLSDQEATISTNEDELKLPLSDTPLLELWTNQTTKTNGTNLSHPLPAHATAVYKILK